LRPGTLLSIMPSPLASRPVYRSRLHLAVPEFDV
jgi:hypothetical protein